MSLYVVSYDLHNEKSYPPVWKKLEGWGATRLLESLWVVTSSLTAAQIRDGLQAVTDADDSLAVIELQPGSWWAGLRTKPGGVQWLRDNLRN